MTILIRLTLACAILIGLSAPAQADRVYSLGHEFNSTTAAIGAHSGCNDSPTFDATSKRSGTYGLHLSALTSGTVRGCRSNLRPAGESATMNWYAREYIRFVTLPSATTSTVLAFTTNGFTTRVAYVKVDNTGAVTVFDEDGQVGSTCDTTVSTGTWYRFELHLDGSPAAGSDVVEFRINGTDQTSCSATNRSIATAWSNLFWGGNGNAEAQTTGEWYIDDIAVNDTAGSAQTSWPGAGAIGVAFVDADGDTTNRGVQGTDWDTCTSNSNPCTTGTGGTAYQSVDDSPTTDSGSTSIIFLTESTGTTDAPITMFSAQTLTSTAVSEGAAIDGNDTITYLGVKAVLPGAVVITKEWRLILSSSGTATETSEFTSNGTTFAFANLYVLNGATVGALIAYTNPSGGSAWTLSAADAVEIGIRPTTNVVGTQVSQLVLEYEWVPVANGGSSRPSDLPLLGVSPGF